ncbi:MAG: AAC(3) family N-acetyltransferase [Bacteroidales bacterium]
MENQSVLKKQDLINDLNKLGLQKGDIVNVKASLKSIGFINGGANTLVEALIDVVGNEGAILTESFIKMLPIKKLNKNNSNHFANKNSDSYAGALTNAILKHPNVIVGNHPTHRYAAIGEKIALIVQSHTVEDDPYLVLERIAEAGAKNLRIGSKEKVVGVGTTHIAINKTKLRQKRPRVGIYYKDGDEIKLFENWWATGCEKGFNKMISLFNETDAIIKDGKIGNAEALLTSMKRTLEIEYNAITSNPTIMLCDDPACAKCRIAWEFIKGNSLSCVFANIKKLNLKGTISAVYYIFNNNYLPKK